MTRIQSLPVDSTPTTPKQWVLIQRLESDLFAVLVRLFHNGGGQAHLWIGLNDTGGVMIKPLNDTDGPDTDCYPPGLRVRIQARINEYTQREHLLDFAGTMTVKIAKKLYPCDEC